MNLMKDDSYKLLVVEDSVIEKKGYEKLLDTQFFKNAGFEFVGCVENKVHLFRKIKEFNYEKIDFNKLIVLLDVRLNNNFRETEGLTIPIELIQKAPGIKILLNSKSDAIPFANMGLPELCGNQLIYGFITKDKHNEISLLNILNKVKLGKFYFDEIPETWLKEPENIDTLDKEMMKFYWNIYGLKLNEKEINSLLPKFKIEWYLRQKLGLSPLQWNIFLWIASGKSKKEYLEEFDFKGGHFDVQISNIRRLLELDENKNYSNFLLIGIERENTFSTRVYPN